MGTHEQLHPVEDVHARCEQIRRGLLEAYGREDPVLLLTDPPFVTKGSIAFVLRCELIGMLLPVLALIALFVWLPAALVLGALAALAWILRWTVHLAVVVSARRRLRECRVLPAVVVQAFDGGFLPPEGDANTRPFTGVVVFSFDEAVGIAALREVGPLCFAAKSGPDAGPMAAVKRLLLQGDVEFVHVSARLPAEIAGNERTFASPILFVRENDLPDGHLSTLAQPILAHPERPEHVCPVPLRFWAEHRDPFGERAVLD